MGSDERAADWRRAVEALTDGATPPAASAAHPTPGATPPARLAMGLHFELREVTRSDEWWQPATATRVGAAGPAPGAEVRLGARPVVRGPSGRWTRQNIGWGSIGHHTRRLSLDPGHQGWLAQFLVLARASRDPLEFSEPQWVHLDGAADATLWAFLASAADAGVALVGGPRSAPVALGTQAMIAVEIVAVPGGGGDLRVAPTLRLDGVAHPARTARALGAGGVYAWRERDPGRLALAPTASPLTDEQRRLLLAPDPFVVPAADAEEFLAHAYPRLRRGAAVSSPDASVALPAGARPVLVLRVERTDAAPAPGDDPSAGGDDEAVHLRWRWRYPEGEVRVPLSTEDHIPRDPLGEREILAALPPELAGQAVAPDETLEGTAAALFDVAELPRIRAALATIADAGLDLPDEAAPLRAITELPELAVTRVESHRRDWFDLGVVVTVEGRQVPLQRLFTALAKGATRLRLVDRSYLPLTLPVFDRLRELIDASTFLDEWETGRLRIPRHRLDLVSDFEDRADESPDAVAWRATVRAVAALDAEDGPPRGVPEQPPGLHAELRPYQRDGYAWLVALWRHGLGGVLADDMGLGKTVQTLALVAHARALDPAAPPFLVVAPTSVVPNWLAEAARFTPDLRVVGVVGTQRATRRALADAARAADIVVTSYALFRLDAARYRALGWSGLILDEAQFVKNPATRVHAQAVALDTPFKLAITGTPLENSLTDLWALFRITAPGLFPSARAFREGYVQPVEAGFGAAPLARLRRRIRPFLLRRTKEQVAPELPDKHEHELSVELAPAHRQLYDQFLQRERQKLLGLLADLDRNRFIVFRSITLLRLLSLDAGLLGDEYAGIPSAKLDALVDRLRADAAAGRRALVFSQFTTFLRRAERRLAEAGIRSEYLDGATRRRAEVVARFREGGAPVFLISLKAGGFGLNLTEADDVYLLDPWWNPAVEEQAVDRTHRIGQTRPVTVHRLISAGTIEEKVMQLKDRKAELLDAVLRDDVGAGAGLTADDVRMLLG